MNDAGVAPPGVMPIQMPTSALRTEVMIWRALETAVRDAKVGGRQVHKGQTIVLDPDDGLGGGVGTVCADDDFLDQLFLTPDV